MKKKYRIKKSDEIELVMKKGTSKANRTFIVYRYKQLQPSLNQYRIAISAPKKLGNAVVRNKIKRQMRAILQQQSDQLDIGYDYFIVARPDFIQIDFKKATHQMKHVLNLFHQPSNKKSKK